MTRNTKIIFLALALVAAVVGVSIWIDGDRGNKQVMTQNKHVANINISKSMNITSPAFEHNQMIPDKYSCRGEEVSPPLQFAGMPQQAKSLVLVMDDPDAPGGTWIHWLVWNIDPGVREIKEGMAPQGGIQGLNSSGEIGYQGPCPPSGVHRYYFRLYALDTTLSLPAGSRRSQLEDVMQGHILMKAELMGLHEKK